MADKEISVQSVANAYNDAAQINGKTILGPASTSLFVLVIIGLIVSFGVQNIFARLGEEREDKSYILVKTTFLVFLTIFAALIFIIFVTV